MVSKNSNKYKVLVKSFEPMMRFIIEPEDEIYHECNKCYKKRRFLKKNNQICIICYQAKLLYKPSGNKTIDEFIKDTQINFIQESSRMKFVPYNQFKDIKEISKGGFSRVYKATWIDGPIKNGWENWNKVEQRYRREANKQVALKKLNNSKNITSKELNEVQNISYFYILYINES